MAWSEKTRPSRSGAAPAAPKPAAVGAASTVSNGRVSNVLKEFLWLISDVPRSRILDLGPVWQATVTFFVEKGYRVSTEDILRTWKDFVAAEEQNLRASARGEPERVSPSMLAEKFLETALCYEGESFHGILAWDLFDYFDPQVVPAILDRLYGLLCPGGAMLTLFHSRAVERFQRYRIVDSQTVELLPSPTLAVHAHVFQNREILDLFGRFRSSKTFVGRDQVREVLFLK